MVEELEEGEFPMAEDRQPRAERVEETREVIDVRPEEHAPGGARAEGETEEPLERGGAGSAPQPPRVADLGGGGEEAPGEDGGGDERHRQGVDGGERPEGDGAAVSENEERKIVENHGGGDVCGD